MKKILLVFTCLAFLSACSDGMDDESDPVPQSPSAPLPTQPKTAPTSKPDSNIYGFVSFEKNSKEEVTFLKTDTLFTNKQPVIIPAEIPDELTLTFFNRSDWKPNPVKVTTKFGSEERELSASFSDPVSEQSSSVLKIQGFRSLFPDGPGQLADLKVEIENKDTLQIKLGTPPAVNSVELVPLPPDSLSFIRVSPTLTVLPVLRVEVTNTSAYSWTLTVPYKPEAGIGQQLQETKFNQETPCETRERKGSNYELLTSSFLLLKTAVPVSEFSKYLQSKPTDLDSVKLNSQEKVSLTLYALMPVDDPTPILLGRKWTGSQRLFYPGCNIGACKIRLATYTYWGFCKDADDSFNPIFLTCTKYLRGFCDREGRCNFGQYDPSKVVYGDCEEVYKDQLPPIYYSDYTDVIETSIGFPKLFDHFKVHYSDSSFSIEEQASPISAKTTSIILKSSN